MEEQKELVHEPKRFYLGRGNAVIITGGHSVPEVEFFSRGDARNFCSIVLPFAAGLSDEKINYLAYLENPVPMELLKGLMIEILEKKFGLKCLTPKEIEGVKEDALKGHDRKHHHHGPCGG